MNHSLLIQALMIDFGFWSWKEDILIVLTRKRVILIEDVNCVKKYTLAIPLLLKLKLVMMTSPEIYHNYSMPPLDMISPILPPSFLGKL
jgi:hypothetical protein